MCNYNTKIVQVHLFLYPTLSLNGDLHFNLNRAEKWV